MMGGRAGRYVPFVGERKEYGTFYPWGSAERASLRKATKLQS
jgi:hypothetical protein